MSSISFLYSDFLPSTSKKHDLGGRSSSQPTEIMQLKQDQFGYARNSEWLIKSNQFTWTVHEYVASKLYQIALGKDNVSDVVLVQNPKNPLKPMLAVKLHDNYKQNFLPFDYKLEANGFKAKCLVDKSCQSYKKKPVSGFEKAFTVSRLFHDDDISDFNNFALKVNKNSVMVTRYDFDDSFKFFSHLGITAGMTEESLSQEMKNTIKNNGYTVEQALQMFNSGMEYKEFGWDSLYHALGDRGFKTVSELLKAEEFISVFDDLLRLDKTQLSNAITTAFQEIAELVGDTAFSQHYDINELKKQLGDSHVKKSIVEMISDFAIKIIVGNFDKLADMQQCLQVERALQDNNAQELALVFGKDANTAWDSLQCQSFPIVTGSKFTYQELAVCEFGAIYKNDAALVLQEFCDTQAFHGEL